MTSGAGLRAVGTEWGRWSKWWWATPDDSERQERTRPGLLFVFCVRPSSVRGCRFSFVFVYYIIIPLPSARSKNFITLVPKPRRNEGHAVREPSPLMGIAVLRRSGSSKKLRLPVAARGGGAGAIEEQVGRKARCRAPESRRGGCRPRGSGRVGASCPWLEEPLPSRSTIAWHRE